MFLKSQKNSLLDRIKVKELNPRDFSFVEITEPVQLKLTHKTSKFYVQITYGVVGKDAYGRLVNALTTVYAPTMDVVLKVSTVTTHHLDTWEQVLPVVDKWLGILKSEAEQPDLWAELEEEPEAFADTETVTNERFTAAEIKQLSERVADILQKVIELQLPPEAEAAINQTIKEVPAKAKRLTKKELSDTLVGAFMKEGLKWGLTIDHVSAVWHVCQHFFQLLIK